MTTTDEALTEQLWDAMAAEESLHVDVASIADLAAAILPIIRKAQADAAREALDGLADEKAAEAQASWLSRNALYWLADETRQYRDTHYPEGVTPDPQ